MCIMLFVYSMGLGVRIRVYRLFVATYSYRIERNLPVRGQVSMLRVYGLRWSLK